MMTHEEKCKKVLFNAIDEHFRHLADRLKNSIQENIDSYHYDALNPAKADYFEDAKGYHRFSGYGRNAGEAGNENNPVGTSCCIVIDYDIMNELVKAE